VSRAQARIREAVTRNRQGKLTALLHHINIDVLRTSFFGLKKTAAPGVDEMTWIGRTSPPCPILNFVRRERKHRAAEAGKACLNVGIPSRQQTPRVRSASRSKQTSIGRLVVTIKSTMRLWRHRWQVDAGGFGAGLIREATCLDSELLRESVAFRHSRRKILRAHE
jgi:hypothetical protein